MYKLNTIKDNSGARVKPKLIGRGMGSGKGKTSGRGGKGQTARSGVAINGFEGGQNPIYRRLPKRGFKSHLKVPTYEITFPLLQNFLDKGTFKEGDTIDKATLIEKKIISKSIESVVLLGNGELKKKLNFAITRATKNAQEVVKKAGGKITFE